MLAERGMALIKEVDRNRDALPPYNIDLVAEVNKEIVHLIEQNHVDAQANEERATGLASYGPTVKVRHAAIQRNLRCLLGYHYNRIRCLRTMRWEFGSILPPDIKANLSQSEATWFSNYSNILAKYMRSIGDEGGLNLGVDLKPPKCLYIEVKCLLDYGKFELNDGSILLLKKNTRHYLPRTECEELIQQGVFQHIVN